MPNENIENPTPEISPAEPVENSSFADINDLANRQGGTSPIPEPINSPETSPQLVMSPIKNLLLKAKEMIQFRKRKKLEKILELAKQKTTATAGQGKITNNDIQKLLRVSDATATRYLSQLVKEGRLTRQGNPRDAFYQLP